MIHGTTTIYELDDENYYVTKHVELVRRKAIITGVINYTTIAPPLHECGQYQSCKCIDDVWAIMDDYRGADVFSTIDGSVVEILEHTSELPENTSLIPMPSKYHVWDNGSMQWVLSSEVKRKALIKEAFDQINADVGMNILSGLRYGDITIWLSPENQSNIMFLWNEYMQDVQGSAIDGYTPVIDYPVVMWETNDDSVSSITLDTPDRVCDFCKKVITHIKTWRAKALNAKKQVETMVITELETFLKK